MGAGGASLAAKKEENAKLGGRFLQRLTRVFMPINAVGATGRFSVSRLRRRLAGPTLAQKFMGPAQSGNAAAPRGACVAGAGANGTRYELHKVPPSGKKLFGAPSRQDLAALRGRHGRRRYAWRWQRGALHVGRWGPCGQLCRRRC